MIYKLLGAFALVLLTVAVAYLKGRSDGADRIQELWDADRLVAAEAFQQAVANKEHVELERDAALKEIVHELRPALEAAESDVAGLARRLRDYQARASGCPVPQDPAPAGGDSGPGRIPDEADRITEAADRAWTAASRDSARLTACQQAYERVRQAGRITGDATR